MSKQKKSRTVKSFMILCSLCLSLTTVSNCGGGKTVQLFEPQSWRGIIPGKTTKEEVISILGQPEEAREYMGLEYYTYPTERPAFRNGIGFKQGIVQLMFVNVLVEDAPLISAASKKYGKPDEVTYSYFGRLARAYIFARHGVTLIAYEDGLVIAEMYYVPMAIEEFMNQYGKDFPMKNPYTH